MKTLKNKFIERRNSEKYGDCVEVDYTLIHNDIKEAVLEFENFLNYGLKKDDLSFEELQILNIVLNKFKKIFGEFEK